MLSESYPPLSLPTSEQRRASVTDALSLSALSRGLSRLARRRGGWAAVGVVLLITLAIWSVACSLLERWQIR